MRIHVLSDLHLEFGKMPRTYKPPVCDVVILSGDISTGKQGIVWAENTFDVPVLYTPGNHEFYNRVLVDHIEDMRERCQGTNIHFLHNDTVIIDEVRFIGSTMWTDFNLFGRQPLDMWTAQREMNDYATIQFTRGNALTAEDVLDQHLASRFYLCEELAKPHDGKTVVMTHHAPSSLSISERYANDDLSAAYASRLENIMLDFSPVLWTHGHVHSSFDYMVGDTRVVCNPRGYQGHELNPRFDPELVIDISEKTS